MKKTALFTSLLCLAQSTLHADVPLFINYQGKVADSTGLPIGASGTAAAPVAAPVNRKVIFRIYDASTGGNRLWTEEQTATISLGVFSVLLGNGIEATGTASTESRPALDTVFTPSAASSRFLEIMVDNGDNSINASDMPISPRQQITSTAFALHAKVADGIATSTDLAINPVTGAASNYGLGWYGTGRTFNSVAVDGPVLYGNSGGALGSNVSGTQKLALAWNAAGQVGVGAISSYDTNNKLTLQGDDSVTPARQLVIRGSTDSTKRLNIGFDTTGNQATLQSYTAASTAGNLLLNSAGGNVIIGSSTTGSTGAPVAKLSIGTPISGNASTLGTSFFAGAGSLGQVADSELLLGNFGFNTSNSQSLAISGYRTAAGGTWADTALVLGMNVDVNKRSGAYLSLHSTGNVGIGNLNPAFKLDVNGNARVVGQFTTESNIVMADGAAIYGKKTPTTIEACFWPRASNGTYLNYGTSGFFIRNNASTTTLTMTDAGRVGIGTIAPVEKLTIQDGKLWSTTATGNGDNGGIGGTMAVNDAYRIFGAGNDNSGTLYIDTYDDANEPIVFRQSGNERLRINDGGNVIVYNRMGIGTNTPRASLEVASNVMVGYNQQSYLNRDGVGNTDTNTTQPVAIHAEGRIHTSHEFNVTSDSRIKKDLKVTDSASDLGTLCAIEVTDYHLKDTIAGGAKPYKKVIAQQVETVYPQAVNREVGVVPDIYQHAAVKDGWVALATDLKVGEQVSLLDDKEQALHEVLEVRGGAFRVASTLAGNRVFVYGRQVDDFRSVDYDAISMLNVSATQQLAKHLKEKDAKIAALEAKLAAQDKRASAQADETASQGARLIALEKLINKSGAPETVSFKLGDQ